MQNLIIDEITKAVWNEFTAKTHNEKRDYQYSVNDLRNVITEAYKNAEALQLQQTGVVPSACPNCKEPMNTECACLRNKCVRCLEPVGNITFTVCDDCWDKKPTPQH